MSETGYANLNFDIIFAEHALCIVNRFRVQISLLLRVRLRIYL